MKNDQMKGHLILFGMMYGFMVIQVREMVEMAFGIKSTWKKSQDAIFITCPDNFLGRIGFFRKAILTVSRTRMAMKPYIIRKQIE